MILHKIIFVLIGASFELISTFKIEFPWFDNENSVNYVYRTIKPRSPVIFGRFTVLALGLFTYDVYLGSGMSCTS